MKRWHIGLLLGIVLAGSSPVQGQLFFARKTRPNPSQRVPELILLLKTETDERKRQHAVEELREFDTATYTEIVPVLLDLLQNDKKMNVRLEAANGLTRLRPLPPQVQSALEKAANDDESWRVRWQVRATLTKFQLTGISTKKAEPTAVVQVKKKNDEVPPVEGEVTGLPNGITVEVVPVPVEAAPRVPPMGPVAPKTLPPSVNPAAAAPPTKTAPAPQGPALFP